MLRPLIASDLGEKLDLSSKLGLANNVAYCRTVGTP